MSSSQLSSGDVIADRRADYARMMAEGGDHAAAAELMEQALELVPAWAAGWFRLGEYREKDGNGEAAARAYAEVLERDPGDLFGAGLKLAVLGKAVQPSQPSSLYVERLFDDYATRFDKALVERLGYSVPGKLAALIRETGRTFSTAVDLGCGTGLLGVEMRDMVQRLEGYDLSRNMLKEAEAKGVYDHLAQADLSLGAADSGLFGEGFAEARADLAGAADVLMYLGDLDTPFRLARDLLSVGGLFAFSVEDGGEGDGVLLRESLRFAHTLPYVAAKLEICSFRLLKSVRTVIRQDAGQPIQGILFLAEAR